MSSESEVFHDNAGRLYYVFFLTFHFIVTMWPSKCMFGQEPKFFWDIHVGVLGAVNMLLHARFYDLILFFSQC